MWDTKQTVPAARAPGRASQVSRQRLQVRVAPAPRGKQRHEQGQAPLGPAEARNNEAVQAVLDELTTAMATQASDGGNEDNSSASSDDDATHRQEQRHRWRQLSSLSQTATLEELCLKNRLDFVRWKHAAAVRAVAS